MFSYLRQPRGFYRRLFLLALPIIVQNLITTSLGFLDTFMVGLLGSEQMSAVTVANVPIFIIQLIVFGLQSGSSVLISQYWGRGDRESINRVMGIGFMIAGGVSVLFAAILCAFPAQVLYLITDNLTLVDLAEPYLRIVGFSYIFAFLHLHRHAAQHRKFALRHDRLRDLDALQHVRQLCADFRQARSARARHHGCGGSDASVPRGGVRRRVLLRVPLPHDAAHEARHPPPRHGHAA